MLKSFCTAEKITHKMKRQPKWEKISANDITCKFISPKLTANTTQHHMKTNKQLNLKMGKKLAQISFQGGNADGQEAYEKMLNTDNHHGNTN